MRKVANKQTNRQTDRQTDRQINNDENMSSLAEIIRKTFYGSKHLVFLYYSDKKLSYSANKSRDSSRSQVLLPIVRKVALRRSAL